MGTLDRRPGYHCLMTSNEPTTSTDTDAPISPDAASDDQQHEATTSGGSSKTSNLQFFISIVFLGVVFAFVVGLVLSFMTPSWYAPPSSDDEQAVTLAQNAEFRLVEELQKIREPGATWKLRIPDQAVNAWLAIRLEAWLAHDDRPAWPDFMTAPQLHATPAGVYVAVGVNQSILGLRIQPVIEDARIMFRLHGGLLGRLPLPSPPGTLLTEIQESALNGDEAASMAVTYLLEGEGLPARVELVDGRVVEFDEVALEDGAMILTARTLLKSD